MAGVHEVAATSVTAVTNWTWAATMGLIQNLLLAVGGGGLGVALVRAWPQIMDRKNEREKNLLDERADDMQKMRGQIEKLEKRLDEKEATHNAERALDRHRINNLTQCLDAFFMLVKAKPNNAAEAVVVIEEMRAKQIIAEASEKATIHAAAIAAATGKGQTI